MLFHHWLMLPTVKSQLIILNNDQIQFSPLMEASRTGNVQIADMLLNKGADSNIINYVRVSEKLYTLNKICNAGGLDSINGSSKQWPI